MANSWLGSTNDVVFSDREHRILLSALSREMEVCKKVDAENKDAPYPLVPVVKSIERKVYELQHPSKTITIDPSAQTQPAQQESDVLDLRVDELKDLMSAYNAYIQTAFDADLPATGWCPVCIAEFAEYEYVNVWLAGEDFDYMFDEGECDSKDNLAAKREQAAAVNAARGEVGGRDGKDEPEI